MRKNTRKSLNNNSKQKSLNNAKARKGLTINQDAREEGISFSFRYFKQIENFGISGKDCTWTTGLLEQLKVLSEKNADELLKDAQQKKALRIHQLELGPGKSALTNNDFSHIPEKYRPDNNEDREILQFQISRANGRVIGFFGADHAVFYIVFLDPNHNAQLSSYSDYKIREISPCESEIDDLYARIAKHTLLKCELENDSHDFLLEGDFNYLCIGNDLLAPFIKMVEDNSFYDKFRDFLITQL